MRKKTIRKFVLLLCILVLAASLTANAFAADAAGTLQISAAAVYDPACEELTVSLELNGNPGIIAAYVHVEYDADAMTLVSVTDAQLLKGFSSPTEPGEGLESVPYKLVWYDMGSGSADNSSDGLLATMVFHLEDDRITCFDDSIFAISDASSYGLSASAAKRAVVSEIAENSFRSEFVAYTGSDILGARFQEGACVSEMPLGDLVADAYRWQAGKLYTEHPIDACISNIGELRANLQKGKIRTDAVAEVFPFGDTLCVLKLKGSELQEALDQGCHAYPEASPSFPIVSGIEFTLHGSVSGGNDCRVNIASVNGVPFDLERDYYIASNSYIGKDCGDGYTAFTGCLVVDTGIKNDVALANYLKATDGCNGVIPAKYASPQGRITINNTTNTLITYVEEDGSRMRVCYGAADNGCALLTRSKEGYTFNGWYVDGRIVNTLDDAIAGHAVAMQASFTKNERDTAVFHSNVIRELDATGLEQSREIKFCVAPSVVDFVPGEKQSIFVFWIAIGEGGRMLYCDMITGEVDLGNRFMTGCIKLAETGVDLSEVCSSRFFILTGDKLIPLCQAQICE